MNPTIGMWSVQYLEELAHSLVVKAITAVEDDTLDGQCLGQILGGLCLTSTGRAGRCATQVHMDCSYQSTVTPVCSGQPLCLAALEYAHVAPIALHGLSHHKDGCNRLMHWIISNVP